MWVCGVTVVACVQCSSFCGPREYSVARGTWVRAFFIQASYTPYFLFLIVLRLLNVTPPPCSRCGRPMISFPHATHALAVLRCWLSRLPRPGRCVRAMPAQLYTHAATRWSPPVCMCTSVRVHLYVSPCMYICMHVHMCRHTRQDPSAGEPLLYIHMCTYACMHTVTHTMREYLSLAGEPLLSADTFEQPA